MARDGSLSGTVSSKRGTQNILSGSLSTDKFTFTINVVLDDGPADAVFTGTFDGTTMKGNIHVVGIDIEFTGVKAPTRSIASEGSTNSQGIVR
jgi:hypothetical protein